jgi:cell wall-associated NlpC family hydrolase
MKRLTAVFSALILGLSLALMVPSAPARADTAGEALAALHWAEYHETGHWYCWGGAGPSCYDCSGAVIAAYAHALGISLPHSTYAMLASSRLYRIPLRDARRGDLMFYGPGHVEFKTRHGTFGAEQSGTRVGWHRPSVWWHPTMAYRVAVR